MRSSTCRPKCCDRRRAIRSITVSLTDDPAVRRRGRVREVAPQADPVTRTFAVKVGLTDPPEAMRLGATVTGTHADGCRAGHRDPGDAR